MVKVTLTLFAQNNTDYNDIRWVILQEVEDISLVIGDPLLRI